MADLDLITANLRKRLYQSADSSASIPEHQFSTSTDASPKPTSEAHTADQSGNSLLQTVRQVQDNIHRLAQTGVINAANTLLLPPLPPFPSCNNIKSETKQSSAEDTETESQTSELQKTTKDHVTSPEPLPTELLKKLTDDWVDGAGQTVSNSATSTDILTTPRTQRTYSITSEDEEPYSPPVHLSATVGRESSKANSREKLSDLNREEPSNDDWDSDGVKPLDSDDECSEADDHRTHEVEERRRSVEPLPVEICAAETEDPSGDNSEDESDKEDVEEAEVDIESDEGEFEPAFSRTLNEDIPAQAPLPKPAEPSTAHESCSKDTLYNIPDISTSDSGHVTQSKVSAAACGKIQEVEETIWSPEVSSIHNEENNHSHNMSEHEGKHKNIKPT